MLDNRSSPIRQEIIAAGIEETNRARNRETDRKIASFDTRFDSVEKRFADHTNSLRLFSDRVPDHDSYRSMPKSTSESHFGTSRPNHGVMRLATIILPRFSGDKLKDWLFQVEQFFEIHRTPDIDKVNIAAMLMQDVAAQWHQSVQNSDYGFAIMKSWTAYRVLLIKRFKVLWEDSVVEQKNLQATDEQCDVIDEMIQSVQTWRAEMKAMFKRWREEDLIEKQKRKDELSPIEKYFAAKHSIAEESSSDMPQTYIVLDDNSSLDSRTEVIPHQTSTNSTLVSSTNALVKEPSLLVTSFLTKSSIMEKDSTVFQVSISQLEPRLQVHIVSFGIGEARQVELGLDDSRDRSFECLQVLSAEVLSGFFHESADIRVIHIKPLEVPKTWMFKYKSKVTEKRYPNIQSFCLASLLDFGKALDLIFGAEICVVLDSPQATATRETRSDIMTVNWHQRNPVTTLFQSLKPKVLVVHGKTRRYQGGDIWPFSTGVVNEGEYIHDGSVREVKDQTHKAFVEKSDLFILWVLKHLSLEINAHQSDIQAAWVHFALEIMGFSSCTQFLEDIGLPFLELFSPYEPVRKLHFMHHNDLQRLFLLETYGSVLDEFLSRFHSHVDIQVIQVWDPGGAAAYLLGTQEKEFSTLSCYDQTYYEFLGGAQRGEVSVLTDCRSYSRAITTWVFFLSTMRTWLFEEEGFDTG